MISWLFQLPASENSKLMSFGSNHQYLECIKAAYGFSSSELLKLIKEKVAFNEFLLCWFFSLFSSVFCFKCFSCFHPWQFLYNPWKILVLSLQYDLMGKLRSIKHYLLLDQVYDFRLVNLCCPLWTWESKFWYSVIVMLFLRDSRLGMLWSTACL